MEDGKHDEEQNETARRWGVRHVQTFFLFAVMIISFGLRANLSVAVVAMTDKSSANEDFIELSWDEPTKSLVLSSFFWGYPLCQVFIGPLAQSYGAKYFLAGAMGMCAVLTTITPLMAVYGGAAAMCANQMLQGMLQGTVYPLTNVLLSKWAPASEKARLSSFVYGGLQFGSMIMLPASGLLASGAGGWPSVFYVNGFVTFTWVLGWCLLGANSPEENRYISRVEKEYIVNSLRETTSKQSLPTPWVDILKSMPLWSLVVAHFAQHWGFVTLLTNVPNYLNTVLNFNIKSNGYWTSLPYFIMFIMIIGIARITDFIIARGLMSKTMIRKMWNSLAFWGGALALLPLYLFDTSATVALISLTTALALNSGIYSGFFTNHLDLSPNFGGTLIGITNSIGSLASIIGPLLVGFVVTDSGDKDQWGIVFLCLATIFFIGNLFYVLFGSAEIQPWNDGSTNCAHEKRNDRGSLPMNSLNQQSSHHRQDAK